MGGKNDRRDQYNREYTVSSLITTPTGSTTTSIWCGKRVPFGHKLIRKHNFDNLSTCFNTGLSKVLSYTGVKFSCTQFPINLFACSLSQAGI